MCIRQVATLLGYGKPQILEVIKKRLPTRLYWGLFPIEYLGQAVETTKRILTREKIDRQLTGQLSSTPFMSMKESYVNKKVTFDTQDSLEEKTDRLMMMMSTLTTQDDGQNKQFNPKIYQGKKEDRKEFSMTDIIMTRETIRIGLDQIAEIGEFHLVVGYSVDKL